MTLSKQPSAGQLLARARATSPGSEERKELFDQVKDRINRDGYILIPKELYEAIHGLCLGGDWNYGEHARIHRPTIRRIMGELDGTLPVMDPQP